MQIVDVEDGVMAPSGTNKKVTASLLAKELAKQPLEPGIVISGSSSGDAVRITQTGSGNAIVVEDSTNPDATPFVVAGNGHVGIGTASPQAPLDIESSGIRINASRRISSNSNDGSVSVFGGESLNGANIELYGSSHVGSPNMAYIDADVTYLRSADGASERMRITSAGNVGIGTATPTAKLNVVDNSSSDAIRITQTGSGNALVVEDSTNPDATPFVVNDQGQLLIGNSTSLVGPFAYSRGLQLTNQGAQFNAFTSNQFGEGIAFVKTRGTPSSPHTIVQNGDSLGSVSFSGSDGSGYVLGSQIVSFVDQVPGANDMPTCLTFATTPDGSATCTERMRITSAGNVGIGTDTPGVKLDVAGFIRGVGEIVANGAAATFRFLALRTNNVARWDMGISDDAESGSNAGSNFFLHRFSDAGAFLERALHISRATGNVGIGTDTPSSKLHVAGDLTVSSATTATSATAGTNGDVPAQVAGYLVVNINGFPFKIPYYPA
jgi:hypothetical protein